MFDGPEPIYLQIAAYLREQILDGTLAAGDQVMSTTQFATTYRINPATAGKGLALLVDEGLLEKRRGLGTFVAEGARERLIAERRGAYLDTVLAPALSEARTLGIAANEILDYVTKELT